MSHAVREYIESVLFNPPQPLLHYPIDLADEGLREVSRGIYEATGIPCVCASQERSRYWVVYFHGNSENLKTLYPFVRDLSTVLDATVVAFDYPGYYASDGAVPTEQGCFEAAERFVAHVKSVAPVPVIFFGYSMGCAMALHAAHEHRGERFPHAICLLAPFVSAASVKLAHSRMALRFSGMWGGFDVFKMKESALQQGHPLFVATGDADEVIPPSHGKAIADYARKHGVSEFLLVPGATHASVRSDRAGLVYPGFIEFLKRI